MGIANDERVLFSPASFNNLNLLIHCVEEKHTGLIFVSQIKISLFFSFYSSRLKSELAMLKKKGALKVSTNGGTGPSPTLWAPDPARACGRCRAELGRIMNRGAFCKVCKCRVCKSCREYNIKGTDWICTVCHKNL